MLSVSRNLMISELISTIFEQLEVQVYSAFPAWLKRRQPSLVGKAWRITICLTAPLPQTSRHHFWRKNIGCAAHFLRWEKAGLQPSGAPGSPTSHVQITPHSSAPKGTTTASASSHLLHFTYCKSHSFILTLVLDFRQLGLSQRAGVAAHNAQYNTLAVSSCKPVTEHWSGAISAQFRHNVNSMRTHCFYKDHMQFVAKQPTQIFKACLFLHTFFFKRKNKTKITRAFTLCHKGWEGINLFLHRSQTLGWWNHCHMHAFHRDDTREDFTWWLAVYLFTLF